MSLVARIFARFAVVSLVALACTPPRELPALDARAAAEAVEALKLVEPASRHVVAANGLLELERGRVGAKVLDAIDGFTNAPLDMRAVKIVAGLDSADARAGWKQACKTGFDEILKTFASADGSAAVRGACDGARFEQLGVSPSAKFDPIAVTLALVAFGSIELGAPVSDAERALLSALAAAPVEGP